MPWARTVKSILEMWYPGQVGGPATADVLLGKANPGGKLPVTFPADATHFPTYDPGCTDTSTHRQLPALSGRGRPSPFLHRRDDELPDDHGHRRSNGIFQGYRWYDEHGVAPLFRSGTACPTRRSRYSGLRARRAPDGGLDVSFRVRNSGPLGGYEVPQVYVGSRARRRRRRAAGRPQAGAVRPRRARPAPLRADDAAR